MQGSTLLVYIMAWISINFKSKVLNMPVEAELLAPQPGYKSLKQKKDYKVIILLHGANNDRTEWLIKSQIGDLVKELPVVVVMPSGKNSFYTNMANGYRYMDYISEELPQFIKKMFRVSEKKEDWLIAGESMGGYGALICGLNHTDVFGNIAQFSGALDAKKVIEYLPGIRLENVFGENGSMADEDRYNVYRLCHLVTKADRPRIFMNCGEQDILCGMNDAFYDEIKEEYDVIYTKGYGEHNFLYWNERLKEMLPWFMRGKADSLDNAEVDISGMENSSEQPDREACGYEREEKQI